MATVNLLASGEAESKGGVTYILTGPGNAAAQGASLALGYAVGVVGVPPLTPTLPSPASQAVVDLETAAFTWTFVSPQGLSQGSYALRFMPFGTSAWLWYDATSGTLVSTETFNASSLQTATPGVPPLQNGNSYAWSVAVRDSNGTPSSYSFPSYVTGAPIPVVTPTAPTGTLTVGAQTLVWINSQLTQVASWQVIVYTTAQTTASGFVAGQSPWVWTSGVVLGSASSAALPSLAVGTYVAYIQITAALGLSSAWTSWSLDYSYTAPAQPTLTATYNTSNQTVTLTLTGHDTGSLLGNTFGSVYRSVDGGTTWTVVSSFNLVPLPSSGEDATETDATPNPSSDPGAYSAIYYYGVVTGPNGITSIRSATQSVTPSFASGSQGWSFAYGVNYASSVQPMIQKFEQSQAIRGGSHMILGDPEWGYTIDVVGGRQIKLTAVTLAVDDWLALRAMLQAGVDGINIYVTNVYGFVGFFTITPEGYSETQHVGSIAATIRTVTFTMIETGYLPYEGAGT